MTLPISKGYFCLDCEFIGENSRACAKCGSAAIHLAQRWLDRQPLYHRNAHKARILSREFGGGATRFPQLAPNRRAG